MYSLGWRVFRDHFGRLVPADRRRRSVVVGALVALAALVVAVGIGLVAPWPDLGDGTTVVGVVSLALAAGLVGAALVPLRPKDTEGARLYWSGQMMQAPDAIERYFRRGPAPTIRPADRDELLRDAANIRAGLVPELYRCGLLLGVGVLLFGAAFTLHFTVVWCVWITVLAAVRGVVTVIRLGRVERARALAEVLPDAPARPAGGVRPRRGRGPSGSKLALPDEDR